jgi:2-polyprenyl-3-methyl-5-hydroxy-6-metoxy-1,4-benzoquinol methylase
MGNVRPESLSAEPLPGAEPSILPFNPMPAIASSGALENEVALSQCDGKRIGILIVTYNAVNTLTKVLKRITPNVWANVEEVAVFDDASQDDTYELAMGLKALRALPKLTVLKHDQNLGYGGNQKAGYAYFIEKGFDVVVLLHGDGQYAPEILAHLYHPIVAGESDAVFGSRMMKTYGGPLKGGMPLYKYVGNRILSIFENSALGLNLTEFHSGYRAYNLHALRKVDFSKMTDDFHFDTEIIIKLHHQHYTITEVPIPTYYGTELCYVNGLKYAKDVFRAVRRYKQTRASVACHPEFREYYTHYPVKESKYSSHYYVGQLVGSNRSVLDLGCGEGAVAAELTSNGNRVTGVDLLPAAANARALEGYFSADLEDGIQPVVEALHGRRFDRVLLLDVLEHLRRPERLLEQCGQVLEPDGELIISVPNVAHLSVRLLLLFGKFNYTQRGILDRTHMRFFTRKTARNLILGNGYKIHAEKFTVTPLELIFGMAADHWLMKSLTRCLAVVTNALPGLFAYQIMFVVQSGPPPSRR